MVRRRMPDSSSLCVRGGTSADVERKCTRSCVLAQVRDDGMPMKRKSSSHELELFRSPVMPQGGRLMAKQERRVIKATFSLGVDLVARLNACATIRNTSRDALVTAAIEEAVKGLVLFDRAKPSKRSSSEISVEIPDQASESAEHMAIAG